MLTLQNVVFKTPAYLWYLTALLVASIPFCFIRSRKLLYIFAFSFHIIGTLYSESYRWVTGGYAEYERIFLTTRNGLFFALPFMCVGELTWKIEKSSVAFLMISGILLFGEISLVGNHVNLTDDRSMYLTMPIFIYHLIVLLRQWNPNIETKNFGGISSAIYVMQFGIISSLGKLFIAVNFQQLGWNWLIWILTILVPSLLYLVIKNSKIVKVLF